MLRLVLGGLGHPRSRPTRAYHSIAEYGGVIGHRAFVIGAVVEAAAFLEAAISELFKDCVDSHHDRTALAT